jgi:hypothetical protein
MFIFLAAHNSKHLIFVLQKRNAKENKHQQYKITKPNDIETRERDHWGDQVVGGRIILRWIFRKWEGLVGTGWSWLRIGTDFGCL